MYHQIYLRGRQYGFYLENDRFSEFNLNLLQLDSEQLGIPETEYSSVVTLPSQDFAKTCRELSNLAETSFFFISVNIETSKESVKFSITGEHGKGSITMNARDSDKAED